MSGLYNAFFGVNPAAPGLLAVLGINFREVPRLRDAWWTGTEILIYTRCGGGNRAEYAAELAPLISHPQFLREVNDTFDSTYLALYFRAPEGVQEVLDSMPEVTVKETPDERWKAAMERLKTDPTYLRAVGEDSGLDQVIKKALG